jgi:ubiquinol-cytochrome c reductase iron-sulfur subunit
MTDTTEAHDSDAGDSQTRRRFLTAATSAVGIGGVAGVAVPFLGSWNPSEKAKAAGRQCALISASSSPARWW